MILRESEIVPIVICGGILLFILLNYSRIRRIPESNLLVAGFCMLAATKIFGVLEEFFWEDLLNLFQHSCFAGSVALLTVWCWMISRKGRPHP